jgi:[protein-PII] uridylyltransferase
MTIRTSLLEARYIWGDQRSTMELKRRFQKEIVAKTGPGIHRGQAGRSATSAMSACIGDSRYVVEPNIKEGKGGLRDLHTLFWIAKVFLPRRDRRRAGR